MKATPEQIFRAFADATRLRILRLMAGRELCVCDLTRALRLGQSKVSRHLAYLQRGGLIVRRDQGRWSYYSIAKPPDALRRRLLGCVQGCFDGMEPFRNDAARLLASNGKCD